MTIQIRPMRRSDVPLVLPLLRRSHPCRVLTEEAMLWRHDRPSTERGENTFVALEGGSVVGFVRSVLLTDDAGSTRGMSVLTTVDDSHRDTDLADHLLDVSEKDLVSQGAEVLRTFTSEEAVQVGGEALRRVVLGRGYVLAETHRILGLELDSLPDLPTAPAGVELRPFSDYADDPRPIYEIDRLTTLDEPGGDHWFPSYGEWRANVWGHPLTALDLCLLVLVEGTPAAITCYASDGTRMESSMTGTLREYRGRGLAGYAKAVALHRARERGVTHAYTGNHADNRPMLTINERLGYRTAGTEGEYVKRIGGRATGG
ncbi:N-acetyltransferase [Nocardiopsis sp. ATB16-24]|uniref:N-acetyltransferase n=1 Tax=Nocardiopsis sp. ATB16-24 TaxID=3019555 RepID=UPI002552993F|nr:N-acetyltransferase [Nocardiopsis sp. ATB16-24]